MRDDQIDDEFLSRFRAAPDPAFARRLYGQLARRPRRWWPGPGALARLLLGGSALVSGLLLAWVLAASAPQAPQASVRSRSAPPAEALLLGRAGGTLRQATWLPAQVVLRVNASPLAHHHS